MRRRKFYSISRSWDLAHKIGGNGVGAYDIPWNGTYTSDTRGMPSLLEQHETSAPRLRADVGL
jgi:hypothetical protein